MKVWDLHCDTLYELRRAEKAGAPKSFLHNDLHIDLEKLRQGDYLLQCFAAYVDLADPAPGADPLVSVLEEIDIFKRLMAAYPEKIAPVYTAADLERNRAEGKLSAMLTVEEGGCCKGSLGVLRSYYVYRVGSASFMPRHFSHVRPSHIDARYLAGRCSLGVGV